MSGMHMQKHIANFTWLKGSTTYVHPVAVSEFRSNEKVSKYSTCRSVAFWQGRADISRRPPAHHARQCSAAAAGAAHGLETGPADRGRRRVAGVQGPADRGHGEQGRSTARSSGSLARLRQQEAVVDRISRGKATASSRGR